MDCVSCNTGVDYNRVAVDRPSGEIIGMICVPCGEDIMSRSDNTSALTMATCLLCGDKSDILFPKWDSIVEAEDGPKTVEYSIELTTPGLCESCLTGKRPSSHVQIPGGVKTD